MLENLFPTSFVRGIERLRIVSRHRLAGVDRGEHAARRPGSGMDFRDYRPYLPGDDLRRVDWNVYRRMRRLTTRVYDEVERLAVYVLLDASASMFQGLPPRANAARQMAAAIAVGAMRQHDRAMVLPFGAVLETPIRVTSQRGLAGLLQVLTSLPPAGVTDFGRAVHEFQRLRMPSGLVAVVSDFFDQRGVEELLGALGQLRHRLALIQIVRATDRTPRLSGDVRLLDCETNAPTDIRVDGAVLAGYQSAYDRFQQELDEFCARRQAPLARIDAAVPILDQLHLLFPGGVLRL